MSVLVLGNRNNTRSLIFIKGFSEEGKKRESMNKKAQLRSENGGSTLIHFAVISVNL